MATLKEIQTCELEILENVARVCEKHGIDYYLSSGTLLGAVRHNGFIPWDDDIDIIIKQKDIKRFKKVCKKDLPEKFFVQDYKTDRGTPYISLKVRNKNTYMPETENAVTNQGIWIDVFPVIKTPLTQDKFRKQVLCFQKYQYYLANQSKLTKTKYSSFLNMVFRIARELFVYRPLTSYYYGKIKQLSDEKSNDYIAFDVFFFGEFNEEMVSLANRKRLKSEWFESKKKYEFAGNRFYGFSAADDYLKSTYGEDYMTPKKYSHFEDYSKVIAK